MATRLNAADKAIADQLAAEEREREQENGGQRALPDESDYAPAWLEIEMLKQEYSVGDEEVSFEVFREGPAGYKDITFIKRVPPDEFSYEMLQSPPFNGGKFRVYIRSGKGFKRNFGIKVEPLQSEQLPVRESGFGESAVAGMIAAMQSGFTAISNQLQRTQQAQPQGMGVEQTISLITALGGLTGGNRAPQVDPLEMVGKIIALQRDLAPPAMNANGEVDGGALIMQAMKTFGEPLAAAMQAANSAKTQAPNVAQVVANPIALPAPASVPENQPIVEEDEMNLKLTAMKPIILVMARSNADPYPYASMMLDMFTQEEIGQYITAPDWFEQLCTRLPEAAELKPWFSALRDAVIEQLQPEQESGSVPTTGIGAGEAIGRT